MTDQIVEGVDMTREEFIEKYIQLAQDESLEAADNWVKEILSDEQMTTIAADVVPAIITELQARGITPQVRGEDAESPSEDAQEASEGEEQGTTDSDEDASEDNTEASSEEA